jgi:ferric-dicitrate binding protein FerR (iron transport regulator)
MSGPRYARLASRVISEGPREAVPPPSPMVRAEAIGAIERAIAQRARARKRSRWIGGMAAAAAVAVAALGGARFVRAHHDAMVTAPAQTRIVGRTVIGAASVVVAGEAAPVVDGRELPVGSRVVTAKVGRLLLAFSTGTSGVLEDAGDVTLDSIGASQALKLDSGSLDLHVAKQSPDQRFVVRTADSEVEVRGTQFRVWVAPADAACGAGTTTRVAVSEGVAVVRHAGGEAHVSAGEQWPAGCASTASTAPVEAASVPVVARAPSTPASVSTLGVQNDLFARAIAAKRNGDAGDAIAGFDRFLARYPASPLAESATVERMRLLRASDPARAAGAARAYLARYPEGFAHAEAQAILAGSP